MEWYRNLQIVLSTKDKLPFLEQHIPTLPVPPEGQSNPPDVNLEHLGAYDMLKELKTLYVQQADQELLQTVQEFHAYKQEKGQAGMIKKNQKKKSHKAGKGNQGKGKAKMGYAPVQAPPFAPKPKNPLIPKKDNPTKDAICHQCGQMGHWRRNCPIYLSEMMKKKKLSQGASTSGLRGSRKLKPGALSLYMGDGHRAAVEAIGDYHLCLPSGLVLILQNCHYAPFITRGIISVSRLYKDGFVNRFKNDNSISIFKNNMIYFNAIPQDDIYEIVMSSSITNITNKRAKLNLDFALLWHFHLGHINKKRIKKLQHDGLLDSTDIKSFEKCVACMSGKMERKPYSHQVERAKDLLGLIHTDEVENQLGKTIKSLRSDRGGEYMSQEFLDHLKDHGIISHRTPPYMTQHNGVSERRNRTLLDMVLSMMSQTTLLKSFWDYALESATRILNMIPTKKVEKTPYEVWHGQALKLSYLKVWGCEALIKRDTLTKPDKLKPRSIKCIFVGYPKEKIGYSFFYPPKNKVFVTQNAEFLKNGLIAQEASGSLEDLEIIQEEDMYPSLDTSLYHEEDDQEINEPQSDINPIHRSTRICLAPDHMFELPPGAKTIGHKWLFKKKTDMDGAVHTYKARLVAKGFTQTIGINYEETVADIRAIRILIAIAVRKSVLHDDIMELP
ncbi:retrotransposon protein, putative, ty1-copia subclass [Tanacetum coccineum]